MVSTPCAVHFGPHRESLSLGPSCTYGSCPYKECINYSLYIIGPCTRLRARKFRRNCIKYSVASKAAALPGIGPCPTRLACQPLVGAAQLGRCPSRERLRAREGINSPHPSCRPPCAPCGGPPPLVCFRCVTGRGVCRCREGKTRILPRLCRASRRILDGIKRRFSRLVDGKPVP